MKSKLYKIKTFILTIIAVVLVNGLSYAQTEFYTKKKSFATKSENVGHTLIEGSKYVPIRNDGYELPFLEDFSTGSFQSNGWSTTGGNWRISTQIGNNAPAAEFTCDSAITNYNQSFESNFLIGTNVTNESIKMDFDLKYTLETATKTEFLAVEIHNGEDWTQVAQYTNAQSTNWNLWRIDITPYAKGKVFRVRFTAKGENTLNIFNWLIDNVHIYSVCEGPKNLWVMDNFATPWIFLGWDAPSPSLPTWLAWDDGVNAANGIGSISGGTFSVASRFTPAQLAQYTGTTLTRIKFFPIEASGCAFELKVWTGANASQLVSSQPITFTSDVWNEIVLDTPVPIWGSTELWFGYTVTHPAGVKPAGVDAGPAVAGYGDMISTDGTWKIMSSMGPDFNVNWNLQGFVESLDGNEAFLLEPMSISGGDKQVSKSVPFVINPFAGTTSSFKDTNGLLGYNIYRDDEFIATTTETTYIDNGIIPNNQLICYHVTAVYEGCESALDYEKCIWVSVKDVLASTVKVYPNPSSSYINIELANNINRLVVFNYVGQVVFEQDITIEDTIKLNVHNYEAGIYIIKFTTQSGESFSKKLIVTK